MIGIYKITSPSGRIYIGQSINIEKRFLSYKGNLAKGQKLLNRSFIKYDIKNHIFEIMEECLIEQLNNRERYWQDFYNVLSDKGLNLCLTRSDEKPKVVSDFFRETVSKNNKLRIWTNESRKKIADKQKINMLGNTYKKGFKHSDEFKKNRSILMLGNTKTLGMKLSNESRIKMSNNSTVKKIILDTNTGVYYNSLIELAKLYNIKSNTLGMKLTGYNKNDTQFIYA